MEIKIVSGEGERGTAEVYTGTMTIRALKMRLTKERCRGDRFAFVTVNGERVNNLDSLHYILASTKV